MKKIIISVLVAVALFAAQAVSAESNVKINLDGKQIKFTEDPIVLNDKTLVQLRPIAEALALDIEYVPETGRLYLTNNENSVVFTLNSNVVIVNAAVEKMDVPMVMYNDYTFVPVRKLAEPFGYTVLYDNATKTVSISSKGSKAAFGIVHSENTQTKVFSLEEISSKGYPYFYQSQQELELPGNGRGYCWVCSYAMLFSNILKKPITPNEIAQFNIDKGYDGNYMANHAELATKYGLKAVSAISEDSPYYAGFNLRNRGETAVACENDDAARILLRTVLDRFPNGVIVRYEGYPHSMVAVAYDSNYIYFNDPGTASGEHVTFEKTCLKNFKLSDISSIQAFEVR